MKHLCSIALLIVLLAFPSNARADVAPPIYPPGSNPQPGAEITQVRMAAETVVIEVLKDITPQSLGRARVTADFTMHNLGPVDESMAVRFPIAGNDGHGGYPELGNLQLKVNGKQVPHRLTSYPDDQYPDEEIPWAEFDVTFPAGQDVPIQVAYDLTGSGYYPFTAFYYILETGAGWKDSIGSADIILRLPYEASPQNVIMDLEIGWATTTPGAVFQGNEARWHFDNFEPGESQPVQNMEFALVAPAAWQTVMNARANVDRSPNDGEAWGMLGKAYKGVFQMSKGYREDVGGQELYQMSVDAYERCLAIKPNDAQWHAGFADLLAERAMWDSWVSGTTPDTFLALEEIHTALELAPNDPVVREIAGNLTYMLHGGIIQSGNRFDFPWLTQTPTALPPTPTMLPLEESTATPPPFLAATETPQAPATQVNVSEPDAAPVPRAANPICGSAAFLPLVAMAWFTWKRKPTESFTGAPQMNENLEKAKRLFFDYSCSKYFMFHDGASSEYQQYGATPELEEEWRKEYIAYWTARLSTDDLEAANNLDHASAGEALPDLIRICDQAEGYAKLQYAEIIWRLAQATAISRKMKQLSTETCRRAWESLLDGKFNVPEHFRKRIALSMAPINKTTPEEYVINSARRQLEAAQKRNKS